MRNYLAAFRRFAVSGLVFLLPIYIVLVVVTKAWTSLSSLGARLASLFGLKSIMGVGASSVLSGLSLLVIWVACGWLAEVSLVAAFRNRVEGWLASYIPGFAAYESMLEDKLQGRTETLSYPTALLRQQDVWRPVYVIEQDGKGTSVVFAPDAPDPSRGATLLVAERDLRVLPSVSAVDLEASLKKCGAGLVSKYRIERQVV
jgi:uncharacterized membrane protein